jgi:enoyl-CoA hydratase/carnithine racemase
MVRRIASMAGVMAENAGDGQAGWRGLVPGLRVRTQAGVLQVLLDRPAKRNAITLEMYGALTRLFEDASARRDLRAVSLSGAGGCFSSGADIADFPRGEGQRAALIAHRELTDGTILAIQGCAKPVVACIDGFCLGGGLSLAMACDFRIAAPDSVFAIPAARLGVVYGLPDTRRLAALVGLTAAKRILYLGDRLDAPAAQRIGLVDDVALDAAARAAALLAELAQRAPLSIAGAKATLDAIAAQELGARIAALQAAFETAMDSQDFREAATAFLERRTPRFEGR